MERVFERVKSGREQLSPHLVTVNMLLHNSFSGTLWQIQRKPHKKLFAGFLSACSKNMKLSEKKKVTDHLGVTWVGCTCVTLAMECDNAS